MALSMDDDDVLQAMSLVFDMSPPEGSPPHIGMIRRKEVGKILNFDSRKTEEILRFLKSQGLVRFQLFGCVQITHAGRIKWLAVLNRLQSQVPNDDGTS